MFKNNLLFEKKYLKYKSKYSKLYYNKNIMGGSDKKKNIPTDDHINELKYIVATYKDISENGGLVFTASDSNSIEFMNLCISHEEKMQKTLYLYRYANFKSDIMRKRIYEIPKKFNVLSFTIDDYNFTLNKMPGDAVDRFILTILKSNTEICNIQFTRGDHLFDFILDCSFIGMYD